MNKILSKILSHNDLKSKVLEASMLEGEFVLRSGQITNRYFDKYLFESSPDLLYQICWQLSHQFPQNYDILGGLEMGGISIATILGQITGKPVVFVRKEAKSYGTCKLAEGIDFKNKRMCIVEDVITTGGQVIKSCQELIARGAIIDSVFCVILRSKDARKTIDNYGYQLYNLFDFSNNV